MSLPLLLRAGLVAAAAILSATMAGAAPRNATMPSVVARRVVAGEPGRFLAWPANNGIWSWQNGREILVGFHDGPWQQKEGHKVGNPQQQRLARSLDGGLSWRLETPSPYVGREGEPQALDEPLPLADPNLAIRVAADGRDGPQRLGRFFVSRDRGRHWQGPFRFEGLEHEPALRGLILTSRTAVRSLGPEAAQFLLSARDPRLGRHSLRLDKTFVAETHDGGRHFRFVSWVVPWSDPYRAVMPSLVDLGQGRLVAVLRRRDPRAPEETPSWIDAYGSDDGGQRWHFLSRVGSSGAHNGNPAALARLPDGRLAVAYANRSLRMMVLRFSDDDGRHWGPPLGLRANRFEQDMGYPQMVVNHRGELVILYYLATAERPHSHIEATLVHP